MGWQDTFRLGFTAEFAESARHPALPLKVTFVRAKAATISEPGILGAE